MTAAISGMPLFLLQNWVFWPEDDPMAAIIVLVGIGVIIVFSVVFKIFNKGMNISGAGRSRLGALAPRKFNALTLHRIATAYNLDRKQTKFLEYVFRTNSVSDPFRVLQTPTLLDRHFKRAFRTIEKNSVTEEDAQENLEKLFSLRNTIEAGSGIDETSPVRLSEKTPAILGTGKDNFPVKVITSRGNNVVIETPKNSLGTPIRLSKGTSVSLAFFTKSSNGFSLEGQITGPVHTDFGPGFQITHSGRAKPLVKRKFRRKQTDLKCEFFLVNVIESGKGKKKTSKLVVDNRKFKGAIQDISAGGCALKSSAPVPVSSKLKIVIDYDENHFINVLGQVIRSNRSMAGTIIHIKFLKVPRRAFNSISTMVYGYNDT